MGNDHILRKSPIFAFLIIKTFLPIETSQIWSYMTLPIVEPGFHVAYIIGTRRTVIWQQKHRRTQVSTHYPQ